MKEKVIIGLSGGVDSATAVHFLNEAGYEVVGMTLKMLPDKIEAACSAGEGFRVCCSREAVMEARICAMKLGIPHYVVNCSADFQSGIIDYFIREYLDGRTPNPCVFCNQKIKFKFMMEYAEMMGAKYVATGHYADTGYSEKYSRTLVRKPADASRDQSYMLCMLPLEYIEKILLPLGRYTKPETRKIAADLGLIVANKPDSQEICFIPDGDYQTFIRNSSGSAETAMKPGKIVDARGTVLGKHAGIINYTVGQRKGLGLTSKEPLYVVKIDALKNEVVVGLESEAKISRFTVCGMNWFAGAPPAEDDEYTVKIRYKHRGSAARLKKIGENDFEATLLVPEKGVTPGQILAVYDGDWLLGGAVIK